jgi:pSer/pThr/pTyr-binding forkhead associated (FHA) protein
MRTVLTIGREPDNDLVINLPIVSGHHARVTWEGVPGQALIEDLGSSNGTAIGHIDRKITRSPLSATDLVYLGNHPIPGAELLAWVDPSMAPALLLHGPEMVVGRDPGCHRVIERPTISGRHARLKRSGDRIILEDLGSSNGTFINGQRINGPTEVQFGDLIGFGVDSFRLSTGSTPVASTQRIEAIKPAIRPRATPTLQVEPHTPAPIGSKAGSQAHLITLGVLLVQSPTLAVAIGLISGNKATALALFTLSLAALWFGLSTAVFGLLLDPSRPQGGPSPADSRFWLSRFLILGALCLVECVLAEVVAFPMGGLKGPVLPALGLLILASGVGLAVGSLIVLLAPNPPIAWSGLGVALLALCLFGGGPWPWSLPRSAAIVRMASNAAPSRWAFEGLLVTESEGQAMPEQAEGAEPGQAGDLAEDYFPSESDRMGARADALALASMWIGLVGVGVFLVRFSGDDL